MTKKIQVPSGEESSPLGPAKPAQAQAVNEHGPAGMGKAPKAPPGKEPWAGLSGIVVGTAMTWMASFFSDPETKRNFLLAIPSVSVLATGGALRLLRDQEVRANKKALAAAFAEQEQIARMQLADPILSEEFRRQALLDYEFTKGQVRKSGMASLSMLLEKQKSLSNEGAG